MLGGQRGGKGEVARGAGAGALYSGRVWELPAPADQSPLSLLTLAPLTSVLGTASLEICSPTLDSGPTQSRPASVGWPHLTTGMAGWSIEKLKPGLRSPQSLGTFPFSRDSEAVGGEALSGCRTWRLALRMPRLRVTAAS